MKKLIQGIVEFKKNLTEEYRALFEQLALGQKPDTLFIACSDSRVVPNLFASTNPGDLFVLRNVGNLIPPLSASSDHSALAVIEFAIHSLKVSDVIICGHSECGAIHTLTQNSLPCDCLHLNAWLQHGAKSLEENKENILLDPNLSQHNQISQLNVIKQMEHIKSYPFIQKKLSEKTLRLHGWWFDIAQAAVYCYETDVKKFVLIDENEAHFILEKLN